MNDNLLKVYIISGLTLFILLCMNAMPVIKIGDTPLRKVAVLSDILPEKDNMAESILRPVVQNKKTLPFKEYTPKGVTPIIDYSDDKAGGMDHFYASLLEVKKMKRPIRVAYYGDSFIEGDILTSDLREMLQQKFGGYGIGWIDCEKGTNGGRPTIALNATGFSHHVTYHGPFDDSLQGINQKYFFAYGPAKMEIKATSYSKNTSHWDIATLYFRAREPMTLVSSFNNAKPSSHSIHPSAGIQTQQLKGKNMTSTNFSTPHGGRNIFYGAAMETSQGIIVDNLGLRGNPGFSLGHIPVEVLKDFAKVRPYDLIIIHYGLNAASDKNPKSFYAMYQKKMSKAISNLRVAYPDASILVFSVSDRDQRRNGEIQTMPCIRDLSATQEQIAYQSKVAYFNLFEAMGGDNSMKALVDKGLANEDYTHINFKGGKFVAGKIVESILAGLENYKRKMKAGILKE